MHMFESYHYKTQINQATFTLSANLSIARSRFNTTVINMPAELPANWPATNDQQETTGTVGDDSTRLEHHDRSIDEIIDTLGNLIEEKMGLTPAPHPRTSAEVAARRDSRDDDSFEDMRFVNGWDVEAIVSMPHILHYPVRYGTFMYEDTDIEGRRQRSQFRQAPLLDAHFRALFAMLGLVFIFGLLIYTFL